jgi:hypothetical protein
MLNEKQNNSNSWKNKLETLDCMPDEVALSKDQVWRKLNSRLKEKESGKKILWYWVAAAILLAVIIPFVMYKKEDVLVKKVTLPQPKVQPELVILPSASKDMNVATNTMPVEKRAILINNKQKNTVIPSPQITIHDTMTKAIVLLPFEKKLMPVVVVQPSVDSFIANATSTPKMTKMKLVHINDIETTEQEFYTSGEKLKQTLKSDYRKNATAKPKEYVSVLQLKIPL